MKFQRIKTGNTYFFDLSMGRDGRLWGLSQKKVFQFREADGKFVQYKASKFPGRKQPFLGLPPGVANCSSPLIIANCLQGIISDREGRIWAFKVGSGGNSARTVHYQEKRKGVYKSILIKEAPCEISDITVNLEGYVYVSACAIFLKKPRQRLFKMFVRNSNRFLNFIRVSSGPAGTLWAVNSFGELFELIDGKLKKKSRSLKTLDIDISVTGVVYGSSDVQKSGENERSQTSNTFLTVSNKNDLLCKLGKWNVANRSIDVITSFSGKAQHVAVSKDGTPWTTCPPSGDNGVFRGRK